MEGDSIETLRGIVAEHTVRYEVCPHRELSEGKQVIVGFDLELHGTHDHGNTSLSPGCPRCGKTFADLRRIAEWIVPKDERPSWYDIPPSDQTLRASAKGSFGVVLSIRIEHRHNFFGPIDECEQRCLREMQARLGEIGVPGGRGSRS